jgi:hypothetical protein
MTTTLDKNKLKLLKEVIDRRQPELLYILPQLGEIPLTLEQRENLREALATELCETGLDESDEPNSRGREIEDLIDRLAHF